MKLEGPEGSYLTMDRTAETITLRFHAPPHDGAVYGGRIHATRDTFRRIREWAEPTLDEQIEAELGVAGAATNAGNAIQAIEEALQRDGRPRLRWGCGKNVRDGYKAWIAQTGPTLSDLTAPTFPEAVAKLALALVRADE